MNLITLVLLAALNVEPDPTVELPPLAVSGRDIDTGSPQATSSLSDEEIDRLKTHSSGGVVQRGGGGGGARLPGAWITRGSGQEHLSAVRSPLLSGAGGCGGAADPGRWHSDSAARLLQRQTICSRSTCCRPPRCGSCAGPGGWGMRRVACTG